jgi:hypothetical protein
MTDKEGLERLRVLAADAEKMKPGPYEFLRDGAYGDVRVRATGEAIATDIAARPAELWAACSPEVILGLIEENEKLKRCAGLFSSAIKCGEPWTKECQAALDAAFPPPRPKNQKAGKR